MKKKQRVHKFLATAHKWIGLILGLQVLAWTVGGVVMSWIPIDTVRGAHHIAEQAPELLASGEGLLSPSDIISRVGLPVLRVTYDTLLGRQVAKVEQVDGTPLLIDARTGDVLTPLNEGMARQIAEADFLPEAEVNAAELLDKHTVDYRGPLPVWQIRFGDADSTSLYVSPSEGRVLARRSATWRFYDFFWMLHIMDYEDRKDFNNPLIIAFSFFAALFTISGLGLLLFRFYRRDFNWLLGRRKRA